MRIDDAARARLTSRHHDQSRVARFGSPRFTRAAQHLADVGARAVGCKGLEFLADGIEPDEGIGRPVGEPDLVLVVDPDRIRMRLDARQLPLAPRVCGRFVHADLPGIPVAHPDSAAGIRPDTPGALLRRRGFDDTRRSDVGVDARDVVAGERCVIDVAAGCRRDAVRPATAGRLPYFDLSRYRIEPTVVAALAGEPDAPLVIEGERVEV